MMHVLGLAALDEPHRTLCERGLDPHHCLGLGRCLFGTVAEQGEDARQVRTIVGALTLELVAEVIVTVGQGEAILVGLRYHHRRVGVILGRREREQRRRAEKV